MSGLSNANEPANPVTPTDRSGQIGDQFLGLTKREYAAIQLMASLMVKAEANSEDAIPILLAHLSRISVQAADALLAELAK